MIGFQAAVGKLLGGKTGVRDIDASTLSELNEAMRFQRATTGFSHSWDDDGDGLISPTEQVKFMMDSAAPPTLPVGKVLAPFCESASIPVGQAQALVRQQFGQAAAAMLTALNKGRVTSDDVLEVMFAARRRRLVRRAEDPSATSVQETWDGVKGVYDDVKLVKDVYGLFKKGGAVDNALAGKAKGWQGIAGYALPLVADLLVDKKKNPWAYSGLKIGGKMAAALAKGAKGGSLLTAALMATAGVGADLACELKKMCTGKDCMSVVGDVSNGASMGGTAGAFVGGVGAVPGAVVGGAIGLIKSGFTGGLGKCAKGLYKNLQPEAIARNLKAAYRAGSKFIETSKKFFVDRVVEPVKRVVGKIVDGVQSVVSAGRRVIQSAVNKGRTIINAGARALTNVGRTVTNAMYRGAQYLGNSFNSGVDYVGRKMYESYDNAKRAVSYAGNVIRSGANRAVETGKRFVSNVGSAVADAGRSVYNAGRSAVRSGFNVAKNVASAGYNTAKSVGRSVYNAGKSVYNGAVGAAKSAGSWLKGMVGWRRRRRLRRGTGDASYQNSSSFTGQAVPDALDGLDDVADDVALLAMAALNLVDVADGLYFNSTKGIPVDMGIISYPDIAAKYTNAAAADADKTAEEQTTRARTAALAQSLTVVQGYAMKKVDLDAQIQTAAFMTDTVGRCLLEGSCDLQDDVDRYSQALELMQSRRNDVVFDILEGMETLHSAYQFENAQPERLSFDLPDSPTLGDLTQRLTKFDEARVVAKATRSKELVAKEAVVYYTFNTSTHPDAFNNLAENGLAYVTVPAPPAGTKYRDVRLAGHDVRAYVYPARVAASSTQAAAVINIDINKGGYSVFVPVEPESQPTTYFHANTTLNTQYSFAYSAETCADRAAEPVATSVPNSMTSPYGEWHVKLAGDTQVLLKRATHLRLAFKVRWFEHASTASADLNNAVMFGSDSCSTGPTCFEKDDEPIVSAKDCMPVTGVGAYFGQKANRNNSNNSNNIENQTVATKKTAAGNDAAESGSTGVIVGVVVALALCCVLGAVGFAYYKAEHAHTSLEKPRGTRSSAAALDSEATGMTDMFVVETALNSLGSGTDVFPAVEDAFDHTASNRTEDVLAMHSVGQMTRQDAEQLLRDQGSFPTTRLPCAPYVQYPKPIVVWHTHN